MVKHKEVTICKDNISRDCDVQGEEVCTTQYETGETRTWTVVNVSLSLFHPIPVCETVNHSHAVEDDVASCEIVDEEICDDGVCNKFPRRKCTIAKETHNKVTPQTDCRQVEFSLCGPEACPIVVGEPICNEEVRTVS